MGTDFDHGSVSHIVYQLLPTIGIFGTMYLVENVAVAIGGYDRTHIARFDRTVR
jgi:hypothetical protein